MSLQELVEKFDYHHISKSPAVFDYGKLKWMNGEYIKKMDFEPFYERALPYMKEVITKDYDFEEDCPDGEDPYRDLPGYQGSD